MARNVLITGGTGLVGSRLTEMLQEKGYEVSLLSRGKGKGTIKTYQWDLSKGTIDPEAISNADYIINLAGAGVFDEKWSKSFKEEIIKSRTDAISLIASKLKSSAHHVKAFVSASAIGLYGNDTGDTLIREDHPAGKDFLSEVVTKWESAADQIESLGVRTVKIRIGIVLSGKGGALPKMAAPVAKGAGTAIGTGKQFVSWIHIDDICGMFIKAIEDEAMKGAYNAVAPEPLTNQALTDAIAKEYGKSIHLPNVPAFALKFLLGSEKAMVVLGGNKVSPEKIVKQGYQFKFPDINSALKNLLN
ncbi:MAG: TIGR01777 family oxidoreductase [Cytophagaceae bacterium]